LSMICVQGMHPMDLLKETNHVTARYSVLKKSLVHDMCLHETVLCVRMVHSTNLPKYWKNNPPCR
jgi:hypothetical protein